jgi:hypothetical protein
LDRNKTRRRRLFVSLIILVLLAGLGLVGAVASPRLDGHPLVLSPDLARSTHYLRFASSQIDILQTADAHLAEALTQGADAGNLLEQVRSARLATEDALGVVNSLEQEAAPFELDSLRQWLADAAGAYVEAGRLMVLFINTPTTEAQSAAAQALELARASLEGVREIWTRLAPR